MTLAAVHGVQEAKAEVTSPALSGQSWSVDDDPVSGGIVVVLPRHVSGEVSALASAQVADRLTQRGQPTIVVLDLYDVEGQDAVAPFVAMKGVWRAVGLIARLDLIVRSNTIRIAAITAARILRLSFTVRSER